ncbi:hypothetical protein ABW21_db0209863 [Orbilia brochopaga]|nr:hypothetical protein ABW21_db0209863 [Drechslerella brochopaga]
MHSDASDPDAEHGDPGHEQAASTSAAGRRPPRERLTHFLAIPLHGQFYETLPAPYAAFKAAVRQFTVNETHEHEYDNAATLDEGASTRIPDGAIREFNTLHLTLGVMSLPDENAVANAISTLESLDLQQFLPSPSTYSTDATSTDKSGDEKFPLLVDLRGLATMSTTASTVKKCSVLMIPPTDPTDRLYPFANALRGHFTSLNILQADNRPLKLHATLVNTVYCKPDKSSREKARNAKRKGSKGKRMDFRFDATEVMERYDGHVFAEQLEIDRVQICRMGAKKGVEVLGEDGQVEVVGGGYEVVASKNIWS